MVLGRALRLRFFGIDTETVRIRQIFSLLFFAPWILMQILFYSIGCPRLTLHSPAGNLIMPLLLCPNHPREDMLRICGLIAPTQPLPLASLHPEISGGLDLFLIKHYPRPIFKPSLLPVVK